ncbi:tetratricopeptide TPR_2 repeat-containing protein [Desulfovibrio ferrophilus]|uniref:Tetratricopeptide TPR_2 repeat-containing protein n=1 Tax=Desulfovibrio ferrophilus TaxID=241368 RepID=A0A2Z6AXE8_9BACT|nr:tetratricopeptide TPR_2 repeat-containing protein [Desulfovibrio ferrophilus]
MLVTGILALVLAAPAGAVVYSFGRHPDKERLVFAFDGNKIPQYSVSRTAQRELTLRVPGGSLGNAGVIPDLTGTRFVSTIRPSNDAVVINLKSSAFGYVAFALDERGKLVLDVFSDPLGARWKPRAARGAAAPAVAVKTREVAKPEIKTPAKPPRAEAVVPFEQDLAAVKPEAPEPVKVQSERPAPTVAPSVTAQAKQAEDVQPQPDVPSAQQEMKAASSQPSEPVEQQTDRPRMKSDSRPDTTLTPRKRTVIRLPHVFRGRVLRPGEEAPEDFEVVVEPSTPSRPEAPVTPVEAEPLLPPKSDSDKEVVTAPRPSQQEIVKRMVRNLLDETAPKSKFRGAAVTPQADSIPMAGSGVRMKIGDQDEPPTDTAAVSPQGEQPLPSAAEKAPLPQPDAVPAVVPASDQAGEPAMESEMEVTETEGEKPLTDAEVVRKEALEEVLFAAQSAMGSGNYDGAIQELDTLLRQRKLPEGMREEALYTKADALYAKHKGELEENFDPINGAYEAAVNFNLDSWRVPAALLRRGVINLKVGNTPEAEAFFRILRDKFKGDPNVPLTYYYWGDHHYRNGDYQKAADEFQYLVQVFPDSKFVREASLGLARSLRKLGYDKQAFQIVDYIEKRWPRFYVEFPPFLRLLGDAAFSVEDYDKAKSDYWTYYNIDPNGDESDIILAKLGDIYIKTGRDGAARELYEKAVTDFPDREGGLIAKMRLAEEGVYDEPTVEQMFSIFDRPLNLKPAQIYQQIVEEHPDSPLAPLAQLKMAIWQLWNNKYVDSMAAVMEFENKFPESELRERARSVGVKAFSRIVDQLVQDENFPKIVNLWEDYGFIREKSKELDPSAKLALALSFWKRERPGTALELVLPFMNEEQVPKYSEMAMSLALSIFVDNQAWERVLDVGEGVREWEIGRDYQRELNYAQALAFENLGRFDDSRPLWEALGDDRELDDRQRAYAIFFLARDALDNKQLRKAYDYAGEAYEILLTDGQDTPKVLECLNILIDVTERSGRYRESIKWASEYEKKMGEGNPGLPALRYRVAGLYRKGGNSAKWRSILSDISKKDPGSLYGRMATSDLEMESLEQAARQYSPQSNGL